MTKSNITKGILSVLIIGGILLVVIFGLTKDTKVENSASDLDRLSQITLTDYDGNTRSLGDFGGNRFDKLTARMLVVNSWAVWCPFCVKELPDFAALQKAFPLEITVIAIDRAESLEKVRGFTDGLGISLDMIFLMDRKDDFYKTIGGFSMPETVFIDKDGTVVFHKRGPMTFEEMKEQVEKLLNKQ